MGEAARKLGYHHGNARNALVQAASELLEDCGAAALSLRSVAERAGLSRQAPYNHFTDKEAMLAALVVAGFRRLADELRAAADEKAGTIALEAASNAYIAFAQRTPALFRLMFAHELVDIAKFPDATAASADAFSTLVAIVTTLCPPARAADLSLAAWSIVHGYATLCNEAGIEAPGKRGERARQFTNIIISSAAATANAPIRNKGGDDE